MTSIQIGIIGAGSMAKAHVIGVRALSSYFGEDAHTATIATIADANADAARRAAERFSIPRWTGEWRELLADPEVDAVIVSTPNDTHEEITVAAVQAGKHVLCEKPLANDVESARRIVAAAEAGAVVASVNFNYRNIPAMQYASRLIAAGELGQIVRYQGAFLQDWAASPLVPRSWKFTAEHAGAGPLLAVGCHVIDLAHFLVGPISEVAAVTTTAISDRPLPQSLDTYTEVDTQDRGTVDTEDLGAMVVRFANGALGTIEATRVTAGRRTHCSVEVNGTEGTVVFDYERMNEIHVTTRQRVDHGLTRVVIGPEHDAGFVWALGGLGMGFAETMIIQMRRFVRAIVDGSAPPADVVDGLQAQEVVHAALTSAHSRRFEPVIRHRRPGPTGEGCGANGTKSFPATSERR